MMDMFSELFNMMDMFGGMDMPIIQQTAQSENKACPVCGRTWNDFRRTGRFGCGECYKTFRAGAEQVLRQAHSNSAHAGKIPSKSSADIKRKRRLEELRKRIREAVSREDYETAAKLHSEIKQLEGGGTI